MSDTDLSHIYANANGDLDEAQAYHDALPHELRMHLALGFASKSGKTPHPGKYSGPPANVPADWKNPADQFGAVAENQAEAIQPQRAEILRRYRVLLRNR